MNLETVLPLGVNTDADGENIISIDKLENIPNSLEIFLHDIELDIYHNLKEGEYAVTLLAGVYLNRFEIVFNNTQDTLSVETAEAADEDLQVYHDNTNKLITIKNPKNMAIDGIEVLTILGQSVILIDEFTIDNEITIASKTLSTGAYVVKIETETGMFSTKIIVN